MNIRDLPTLVIASSVVKLEPYPIDSSLCKAPGLKLDYALLLSRLGYDSTPLFATVSNSVEGVIELVFLRSKLNELKDWAATALESMLQAMVEPNEVESLFTDPHMFNDW